MTCGAFNYPKLVSQTQTEPSSAPLCFGQERDSVQVETSKQAAGSAQAIRSVCSRELGKKAEDYFKEQLLKSGWAILAQNFRGSRGEIDLVANRGQKLLCLEVKARSLSAGLNLADEAAEQAVTQRKFYKMQNTMQEFCSRHGFSEHEIQYFTAVYYQTAVGERLYCRILPL